MTRTFAALALLCAACAADPITPLEPHEPTPRPPRVSEPEPEREPSLHNGTRAASDPHHRPRTPEVGAPDYTPREDGCDGDDDDGDGRVDEGFTRPEEPNQRDDDCDGVVDNGTLGAPCGKGADCYNPVDPDDPRTRLACIGGRCGASCATTHRRCMDCWWRIEHNEQMMDPRECERYCVDFWHACQDVGGQCVRGECRRWETFGCFGRGTERYIVSYVAGGRQASEEVVVCQ